MSLFGPNSARLGETFPAFGIDGKTVQLIERLISVNEKDIETELSLRGFENFGLFLLPRFSLSSSKEKPSSLVAIGLTNVLLHGPTKKQQTSAN